jgi:hypothetical protein
MEDPFPADACASQAEVTPASPLHVLLALERFEHKGLER